MKMNVYNKDVKLLTEDCYVVRRDLNENNDCTVRAISNFCNCDYKTAHEYLKKHFKRKRRKGVPFGDIMNKREGLFLPGGLKYKRLKNHSGSYDRNGSLWTPNQFPLVNRTKKGLLKRMYVKDFLETYPKGSFVVVVRNHTFAVIDGIIAGNLTSKDTVGDNEQPKRPVLEAYCKI